MSKVYILGLALAASLAVRAPANAQPHLNTVTVGRFATEKTCTLYQESAGRSSLVATRHIVAESESWRTWLVKDCIDNFATIRTSVEAALASSGHFSVKTAGRGYTLTGVVSQVGGDDSPLPQGPSVGGGYSIASRQLFVSVDVTLRDPTGRIIYGGLLTKHLETASRIRSGNLETSSNQSGQAVYTELQHEVGIAVARLIAFKVEPLRVLSTDDREIHLNYGSPMLILGTVVHVTTPDGGTVRYVVTSASPESAVADVDGEAGDWHRVSSGNIAHTVEADDPAADERRIKRVELPE